MVDHRFVDELPLQPLSDHRDFVRVSTVRHRLVHDDLGMAAKVLSVAALVTIPKVLNTEAYATDVGTMMSHQIETTRQ